ncbi:uncharacterized protein UBRO2_02360 [Ustilago bromivora]|uniref:Tyrosinase copper-binding domain-containing protein n=1 Tax=Ustilago bromivora TaxID=307758 RepID=A0A8H8QL19_9BASI|nr:uncharacterized protein UBRO2_02360 [Ustilago bromivora]
MLRTKLMLAAVIALTLLQACLAKETSFWLHIEAIEKRAELAAADTSLSSSAASSPMLERRKSAAAPASSSMKCTHPVARVSWYTLTPREQSAWISSFKALNTPNKSIFIRGGSFMDDLAMVHVALQQEMHYNACFLACHTAFLRAFYSLMRVYGYKGREAYWDIFDDYKKGLQNAAVWKSFGGDDGKGGPIPNGPFRNLKCGILPNTKKTGYSLYKPHYVTRHFNSDWERKPLIRGDMYTSQFNPQLYDTILNEPNYTLLRQKLEATVHSWIHQSIYGEMALFSAPCEPAFWLLHAEIDRYWRSWQHKHNAWYAYGGHRRIREKDGTTKVVPASLNDTIDFYGMFEKVKVRDVMHPRRGILCYRFDRLIDGSPDNAP